MQKFYEDQYEEFSKGKKVPDPTKNLDAAYKAQSNRKADERQLAKYREVLGNEAPSTIEEFQNIKYNDDKKAYPNVNVIVVSHKSDFAALHKRHNLAFEYDVKKRKEQNETQK